MYIQKLKVLVEKPIKDSIKIGKCIKFCLNNGKLTTYRILDHFSLLLKAVSEQIPQTFNLMYDEEKNGAIQQLIYKMECQKKHMLDVQIADKKRAKNRKANFKGRKPYEPAKKRFK
jgi:hypothetical protein